MKFGAVSAALGLMLSGCGHDGTQDGGAGESVESQTSGLTSFSPDDRYIVTFKNNKGKSAAAQAGQVALELPKHSAVAVYLPQAAANALLNNPNIAAVEVDARRYPTAESTPYGVTMVQANQVPVAGPGGQISLCVIDSGISASHEDFSGTPLTGTNNSGTGNWNIDLCGHGTHVAGTIGATANNGVGVVGVAPGAVALHIVKVFGTDGAEGCDWAYSSGLVAALDACTAAGAQVISMSLGGSRKVRAEESAFGSANGQGVLSIAAAGNDGNTKKSYPASYASVVSVAALDANKAIADFSQQNAEVEIAAPGVSVVSTYPFAHNVTVNGAKYDGNGIEFAGAGTVSGPVVDGGLCDTVGSWSGAVVMCERGVVSFLDKVINVQSGGGAAAVLYNNEPGNFSGTLGAGNSSIIPAISVSQADGQFIVASALGLSADVSSGLGDGYAALDGTSMATPHVSAVAALLWSHFPAASNDDIRNAMNATAEDLGAAGRDVAFGYGLVQTKAAYDYLANGPQEPDCSADGVCNAECAVDADPDCAGGTDGGTDGGQCLAVGTSCSAGSECCSLNCKGKPGNKTCK